MIRKCKRIERRARRFYRKIEALSLDDQFVLVKKRVRRMDVLFMLSASTAEWIRKYHSRSA